ncbi:MAG: radical SAM protein [Candidatus Omnitrophota bacterium]
MRILLISPLVQACNYPGDYYARWPQLGLAYIASTLEQRGHKVRILEKRLLSGPRYPDSKKELDRVNRLMLNEIEEFSPYMIGLTATTPVIMDAYRTANIIKSVYPKIPIVIGGRHATSLSTYTLEQCGSIDIVCRGEGEVTMLELAEGLPWDKIRGITYRKEGGGFSENPDQPLVENLDTLPYPAWHLLDQDFYFQPSISIMRGDYMRTVTMMTSRGCPYQCAFCQSPELLDIYGKGYIRYHSPDRVISEIEYLMGRFKIAGVSFSDDIFSLHRERLIQICNRIIERGINKHLKFIVNLRSDRVDTELLSVLKKAGCIHVVFGSESGSEVTLKRMNKSLSVDKNIEAVELTKRHALTVESNIIIGSPGETERDFLQTIDFLKKTRPDRIFISKFYPLPGTGFFKELIDSKIIRRPQDWNDLNSLYVETDDFTFADMPAKRFVWLRNKMSREIVAWVNFSYVIKNNWHKDIRLSAAQFIKMVAYIFFLYLPISIQKTMKNITEELSIGLRYSLRR